MKNCMYHTIDKLSLSPTPSGHAEENLHIVSYVILILNPSIPGNCATNANAGAGADAKIHNSIYDILLSYCHLFV